MAKKGDNAGEILYTRPALQRMLQIHSEIKAGKYPNANKLAKKLEVSAKSVQRDLQFMKDRLNFPLEYDKAKWGFYYSQEVTAFPTLQVTAGELVALLVAEKALQQYRGTSFEKPLYSAFQKLSASLPETISINVDEWEHAIAFRTTAEPVMNVPVFEALAKATAQRTQVKLIYRKPGEKKPEIRCVNPHQIANINGEWYLFAWDQRREAVRTFAVARIQQVEESAIRFERLAGFSLQQQLKDSFGVHSGKEINKVVLRFSYKVADYIREKKWHASQKIREMRNGDLEVELKLSSLVEVQRWILSWGPNVTVMKPQALVESVKTAVGATLKNYAATI